MVRAYAKPGGQKTEVFWCENCDEWSESFYEEEVYEIESASTWEFNGTEYYEKDGTYQYTMYFCHECSEPVSLGNPPQMEEQSMWICGECNSAYTDQETARECCS